jgi:hypothetical protein
MPADSDDLPRLVLYPFRYRDPLTGKWLRARYVATREDIAARHKQWEIIGPPEIRQVAGEHTSGFMAPARPTPQSAPNCDSNADMQPRGDSLHALEAFLLRLFLQRYATWCVRTRRYAQAQGAARLAREVPTA